MVCVAMVINVQIQTPSPWCCFECIPVDARTVQVRVRPACLVSPERALLDARMVLDTLQFMVIKEDATGIVAFFLLVALVMWVGARGVDAHRSDESVPNFKNIRFLLFYSFMACDT